MGNKGTRITFDENLHGTNVALGKGGVVASRVNRSVVRDSVAFVQQEILKGSKLQIRIEEKVKDSDGTMKIGFTTKLPKTVPNDGDELLVTADYWVASDSTVTNFGEPRTIKFDYKKLNVGDIISIRVREDDGRICCYVNGKYKRYLNKPVNIPALRRNLTSFYGFVELSGAISKISLLPVTNPDTSSRQLGSPRLSPKSGEVKFTYQPRSSLRARADSLKRSQSIPAIATVQVQVNEAFSPVASGSQDSVNDEESTVLKEPTESFKVHPVWRERLSSSLPSETWDDSVVVEKHQVETKKRHSMFGEIDTTKLVKILPLVSSVQEADSTDSSDSTGLELTALVTSEDEKNTTIAIPPVLQDFLISWVDIDADFGTVISDGAFSKSYSLKWMETNCLATQYKAELFSDVLLFAKCQRLVKLRHPNLLQLLGFTRKSNNSELLVITERLSLSLDVVLKKRSTSELTVGPKLTIANDVTKALCYLHQQSVPLVHCSVIPANIYLTAYYSAKLSGIGFGEVAITSKKLSPSFSCYLPLEAFLDVPVVSTSLDVFSFGMTLVQMLTHKEPEHRNRSPDKDSEMHRLAETIELIGKDHLLADLVKHCLSIEAGDRPSAIKLCSILHEVSDTLLEA